VGRRVPGGGRRVVHKGGDLAAAAVPTPVPGLDLVPADFSLRYLDLELADVKRPRRRLRRLVDDLGDTYDVVFIDCPPGITLAIEAALRAADAVLVPVVPAALPLRTVTQLRSFVAGEKRLRGLTVLTFLTMIDRRRSTHRQLVEELAKGRGDGLRTCVPLSADVEAMGLHRRPVAAYAPRSKAVAAYDELWAEVTTMLA
jgi:chromosome partitioning protein